MDCAECWITFPKITFNVLNTVQLLNYPLPSFHPTKTKPQHRNTESLLGQSYGCCQFLGSFLWNYTPLLLCTSSLLCWSLAGRGTLGELDWGRGHIWRGWWVWRRRESVGRRERKKRRPVSSSTSFTVVRWYCRYSSSVCRKWKVRL